jgi:heavy metal translocating P-type ATPase
MLITLVLLGRWIEIHIRDKVAAGITGLYHLTRTKVRLLDRQRERWVSSEALSPGDSFLVFAGERIPLDGEVLEGRGDMDESVLTGEARPVPKGPGDGVKAGSLLLGGEMRVRTTRTGRESSLGQIVALMQAALDKKNPAELRADRITRWFVPAILAMAGATGLSIWLSSSPGEEALLRSLTVLVITCPCALGIAIPIVKLASVGLAKSKGILVRDPAALEATKDLDVLVFDKTGTLTEGNFHLREMATDEETDPDQALSLIASVEAHSRHFLARETLRKAREKSLKLEEVEGFEPLEGMGVKGRVGGEEIFIGNRKLMVQKNLKIPAALERRAEEAETRGLTAIFAGWAGRVHSLLLFGDSLREGIREMVEDLHARRIKTWILSGDSQATTRSVAHQSGIPEFRGETLPQDKAQLIKDLQLKGRRVGMIGDGINDAAALAQADVGFALGTGTNLFQEASDITFLVPDPSRVMETIALSRRTVRTIRQNLFFAFLYNSVAIPLAIAGWLNPLIAVLAMFASSLTVTGNALRISRGRDHERALFLVPLPSPES